MKFNYLLASIGAALFCLPAVAAPQHATPKYKVVAYYLGDTVARNYTPDNINASKLTHINYAFANIKNDEVVLGDAHSLDNFAKLRSLKKKNPHLKTLISIGGWAWSKDFSNAALTPASRVKFAASALAFVREHGFDGVDIDWEYPVSGGDSGNTARPEDKQNFTLLLQSLRDRLDAASKTDGHTYLLTAAIGNNETFLQNTEMEKVARILDWANIMTYDFSGHWNKYAGHHAPLYDDPVIRRDDGNDKFNINAIVALTLKAGVPVDKLVLGMPFYGYSWTKCGATNHGQYQDCEGKGRGSWESGTLDFSEIDKNLVNQHGFTRYWNDHAKAPYLFNAASGEFVTYDDLESLDYKIKFLKEKGLGGAMVWEIAGDRDFVLQRKLAHDLLDK